MAQPFLLCSKRELKYNKDQIDKIISQLTPDHLSTLRHYIHCGDNVISGIQNDSSLVYKNEGSVAFGCISKPYGNWFLPTQSKSETGSFYKLSDQQIEVSSDIVASRTIWYYFDDENFIVSTSQKFIIALLGNFQLNNEAVTWMLSSGTIGPGNSWDKRIKVLAGDSSLTLDRNTWEISITVGEIKFESRKNSVSQLNAELNEHLKNVFNKFPQSLQNTPITLSGGVDSRAILLLLKDRKDLECITWGDKASLDVKGTDSHIAKELAEYARRKFEFVVNNESSEPVEKVFKRYVYNGEGRLDHVAGYMDGFAIWKDILERDYHGIIRGDEGFGWLPVVNEFDVRASVGLGVLDDYPDYNEEKWGVASQTISSEYMRKEDETLEGWRDRLYHSFRLPVILGALNEIKTPYTEIVNPLLARSIILYARSLPDHLRTNKKIFKKYVEQLSPEIPLATKNSNSSLSDIVKRKDFKKMMVDYLRSDVSRKIFLPSFLTEIENRLILGTQVQSDNQLSRLRNIAKENLPGVVKGFLKKKINNYPPMDKFVIAFRISLISEAVSTFQDVAELQKRLKL